MKKKIRELLRKIGPGIITGASDDDPSGIATYSQTGAMFGYNQLWLALFSTPFMSVIQEMCGRIGLVTGRGLSGVIRLNYPRWLLYSSVVLLLVANIFNIGADLGAMAASAQMVFGLPFVFWIIVITAVTITLEVFVDYKTYAKILRYFILSLFAYVIAAFAVKQDWVEVFRNTIFPTFIYTREYLFNIVAILGTTISPYLFFWEADEEAEEEVVQHLITEIGGSKPEISPEDINRMRADTYIGMLLSNLIMFFIIITTASTLFVNGINDINTAPEAAQALRPIAGDFAYLLFAVGIIGTGLLGIPVLAGSCAYGVSEALGWKTGLSRKYWEAYGFYGVIVVSTLVGLFINFIGIDPIKGLYYAAVLNGLSAPPLMFLILMICNNKKIMGDRYLNSKTRNILALTIIILMLLAGVLLIGDLIFGG